MCSPIPDGHIKGSNMASFSPCILNVDAARRGVDITRIPVKKHSFGAKSVRDIEPPPPLVRQPFSPISSTPSSKANMKDTTDEKLHIQQAVALNNVPFTTPSKTATVVDEENDRTPKAMPVTAPITPSTVSAPMHMAMTPAHPPSKAMPFEGDLFQEIEYSFEERRAGFVLLA